ncbi:MAG: hypothetical protein DMF93_05385 [Acidobacteria bacterium]|nr:MAG: hypothetical protein DMF93_05385 [Acidobacteriota bacterium]
MLMIDRRCTRRQWRVIRIRSHSMPRQALTPPTPPPATHWAACHRVLHALSLSRLQAVVGTLAGLASITGAAFSLVQSAHPVDTGELVAIVQDAGSRRSVTGATIEVLTPQDAIVATLTPDATGRATQELKEGVYIVRVSHPRYSAEARRIQVQPRQTTEIRANLRSGSSSPLERAVNSGVGAVKKALRF